MCIRDRRYTLSLTNDAATIGWDVTDVDKWADEDNQEKDPVAPACLLYTSLTGLQHSMRRVKRLDVYS